MFTQSATEKDSSLTVVPAPSPRSPWRVSDVEALPEFRLRVRFLDGTGGIVDMAKRVHSPDAGVFAELSDVARFQEVYVELGAVTWPSGIDMAPDAMYDAIKANGEWKL